MESNSASSSAYDVSITHGIAGFARADLATHLDAVASGNRTSSIATSGRAAGCARGRPRRCPPRRRRRSPLLPRGALPRRTTSWSSRRNTRTASPTVHLAIRMCPCRSARSTRTSSNCSTRSRAWARTSAYRSSCSRIVESACALVGGTLRGARRARRPERLTLAEFITVGLDPDDGRAALVTSRRATASSAS